MRRWLKKHRELGVEFRDRYAEVCAGACRAVAIREQALIRALRLGMRV